MILQSYLSSFSMGLILWKLYLTFVPNLCCWRDFEEEEEEDDDEEAFINPILHNCSNDTIKKNGDYLYWEEIKKSKTVSHPLRDLISWLVCLASMGDRSQQSRSDYLSSEYRQDASASNLNSIFASPLQTSQNVSSAPCTRTRRGSQVLLWL